MPSATRVLNSWEELCIYTYVSADNSLLECSTHLEEHIFTYIYIYIYISSSSLCRAISMDLPDPLPPPISTVHHFRLVFKATSCIGIELLYVGPCWTSCLSMWRGSQEYVTYELVPTSPAVSCISGSSWIVFVMGGKWLYSCCFVGCCIQNLFITAHSILVQLPSSFFSIHFVSVHVVHQYSSIDMTAAWKKLRFILLVRSDFYMTDILLIAVHAFASGMLMFVLVDETLACQRLKTWYLIPPCLTLSMIWYVSRVKWTNPGKGVAPSPTPWCKAIKEGTFGSPLTPVANFPYLYIYIYIYIYIYSPTPVGLSSLANEVIVLLLAFIASLFIYMNWGFGSC